MSHVYYLANEQILVALLQNRATGQLYGMARKFHSAYRASIRLTYARLPNNPKL
ncbi:MAG: hypothetical protein RLP44_19915 [Aggregatilineales bacterium]